ASVMSEAFIGLERRREGRRRERAIRRKSEIGNRRAGSRRGSWLYRFPISHFRFPAHLGASLIAPSNRIVSPFRYRFSMMNFTSSANSADWPRREGKGTCAHSES